MRVASSLAACALLLVAGCRKPRCEDLGPAPIAGKYYGGGSLGDERILRVSVDATSKEVFLRYTTMDGARIRAKYRIAKKTKQP